MKRNPQIYHGEWWVPAVADHDTRMTFLQPEGMMGHERKYTGTLTYYGDKNSTLELYHTPSNFHSRHYHQNEVIWGKDANGHIFTLFNVMMNEQRFGDFSCTKFVVAYILIGEHVLSAFDNCFESCIVQFPYLRNWAFRDNITQSNVGTSVSFKSPIFAEKLLETTTEEGVLWRLWQGQTINRTIHDLTITQTTAFEIEALDAISVRSCMRQIEEFAQFLSLAMFSKQQPSKIYYKRNGDDESYKLVFVASPSVKPFDMPLIPLRKLVDRIPTFYANYHSVYDKISTLTKYLLTSLNVNEFDAPDFVIVAQALEGYYQRFLKGTEGVGNRKWEELIKRFDDIDAIKECNINADVLKDTRDVYSHLYIDDSPSVVTEINELIILTQKCKVLLTCCILEQIGMTHQEISECFDRSIVQYMVYNVKKYEEKKKQ